MTPAPHPEGGRVVVLMGPMASGKSSVGAALATILGADFVDTDVRVVSTHGPIPEIFAAHGEDGFRDLEARAVAEVLAENHPSGLVLALGGGAVLREETRERLSGHDVVYLEVGWDDVAPRLAGSEDRPLLHGEAEASWRELMERRRPVYESVATIRVSAANASAEEVAGRVASELSPAPAARATAQAAARSAAVELSPLEKELSRERRD
ncbi:shikimate kinase [Sinomonas sp. ASV322]|uniref:shikimate kinase n=1 Tax=Sinomonas sp. ASV322 TaxID=3041920 RepID=UPI0027DD696F|nr:shikimate kinase [Sinomonas sp. ASV322]MDQ4501141.1 shikimate kinase [Sinomonas sp. ASV322]